LEKISGFKIKNIFLHNQNWWQFFNKFQHLIRNSIIINVCKILACGTEALGFHSYQCPTCHETKKVFHTCKSRFCSSCGKKATEQWIENNLKSLPNVPWQHITFTLPEQLRPFFWLNRDLTNQLVKLTAKIITNLGAQKNLIPGIFVAIHTFGRDLKPNVHFHISITSGGLSLNHDKWISKFYIHHLIIKKMWRHAVITKLRKLYKSNQLILPPELQKLYPSYTAFNSWLNFLYNKSWVVHLQKPCSDHKRNIKYLGRYLKRPPMAETRILAYDGINVTYKFLDHHDKCTSRITLPVEEFIKRLIMHIPDSNFRLIRYYNWLSNHSRGTMLPKVFALLKQTWQIAKKILWADLFYKSFGVDPLLCKSCNITMELTKTIYSNNSHIIHSHQYLATSSPT